MKTVKVRTTQNIDLEYQIAGLGNRVLAYLLDSIILFSVYVILAAIAFLMIDVIGGFFSQFTFTIIGAFLSLTMVFYHLACEILLNGQSIGKRIMKLKVVRLDGAKATVGNYIIRWLLRLVDFTLSFGAVGLISVAYTEWGQRVGDMAAGTTVISLSKATQFDETIFEMVEDDHIVRYPQVNILSDKDIQLIKEVLKESESVENTEIILKLFKKVKNILEVQPTEAPLQFIRNVLKDYNYINSDFEL